MKIAVVTGSRAEFGILTPLVERLNRDSFFVLEIYATGTHFSIAHGSTYREICNAGFKIDEKVDVLMGGDTDAAVCKSIGLGVIGFADVFERRKPDMIIVLGDRYEILAAVQAAAISKIPIAHIAGGDVTEGAYDEFIRHSITKMSHLHFPTNNFSANRIKQMGENPENVFNVGNLSLDTILKTPWMSRAELEKKLNFKFLNKNMLITFHPETLSPLTPLEQINQLIKALSNFSKDIGMIFTLPNADTGGREISAEIKNFEKTNKNVKSYESLGMSLYLNTMKQVDLVIGNSSSGVSEAPALNKCVVNIGNRQKGRVFCNSIVNVSLDHLKIKNAILESLNINKDITGANSYGNGNTAEKIVDVLKSYSQKLPSLRIKQFFELN